MINVELKPGYIEIFVMGVDSFIVDSNGFSFQMLQEIDEQIKEPEQFEGVNDDIYVFNAQYIEPQVDEQGKIEAPGYWEFNEDEYTEKAKEQLEQEFKDFKKLGMKSK